jgi:FMN phosphatase YigB (HAD superfamily)
VGSFTCADPRVQIALGAVERGDVQALSLDVFDTLLMRRVPRPTDVFLHLGQQLRADGELPDSLAPQAFAELRERAEVMARDRAQQRGFGAEVSIEEIYRELPDFLTLAPRERTLIEHELLVEAALTFPNPDVLTLAQASLALGLTVALISDTYFSPMQIRQLVENSGLRDRGLRIFTSSERRSSKSEHLFDLVLDELDLLPSELLHVGDNRISDVESASRLGIATVHLGQREPELSQILQIEGTIPPVDLSATDGRDKVRTKRSAPDLGLTAARGLAEFLAEGSAGEPRLLPYARFGATIFGPVFTGFAEWVHERAARIGVQRVYCLMREGSLLVPLIRDVGTSIGSSIEPRPLWLSRQVATLAAIDEIDEGVLRGFLLRRTRPTLRGFLAQVGIDPAAVPEFARDLDVSLEDAGLVNTVVERILKDADLCGAALSVAAQRRERLLHYLDVTLGSEGSPLVLVDLGWNVTIQASLDRLLAQASSERSTHGLYLATTERALDHALAGVQASGYLADGGSPASFVEAVTRSPEVLELVTLPRTGSLEGFDDNRSPLTGRRHAPVAQFEQEEAVRAGIRAFAETWAKMRPADDRLAEHPELLRTITRRFVMHPTANEFSLFRGWYHEDDFGSSSQARLDWVDPGVDWKYLCPVQLLALPNQRAYWPAGVAARDFPQLASAAESLLDGAPSAAVGQSVLAEASVELFVGPRLASVKTLADQQPIVVNGRGRALVELRTVIPDPRQLHCRIQVPRIRQLFVDRIRIELGVRELRACVVTDTSPVRGWRVRSGRLSRSGCLQLVNGQADLATSLRRLTTGHIYSTTVRIYLRLATDDG